MELVQSNSKLTSIIITVQFFEKGLQDQEKLYSKNMPEPNEKENVGSIIFFKGYSRTS